MNEPIKGQAFTIEPFVLLGSGGQILAAPLVEKSDVTVAKDGGAAAQIATAPVVDANGVVTIALTAAEMNADRVDVNLVDDDDVWENVRILIGTSTTTAAQDVRTELATELAFIDAAISSRLPTAGYSAPDNAGIAAIQAQTDLLEFVGGDIKSTLDGEQVVASNMRGTDGANTVVPPTTGEISAAIVIAFPDNFSLMEIDGLGNVSVAGVSTFDPATDPVIVGTNNDKTGYSLTQALPTNFSLMSINGSGEVAIVGGGGGSFDPETDAVMLVAEQLNQILSRLPSPVLDGACDHTDRVIGIVRGQAYNGNADEEPIPFTFKKDKSGEPYTLEIGGQTIPGTFAVDAGEIVQVPISSAQTAAMTPTDCGRGEFKLTVGTGDDVDVRVGKTEIVGP